MERRMKASVRAQDVAALAGVSQSAVSRTFTPGASVSEDTRRKVLSAAQQVGYRPNALARSLITRRSRIVALVMSYLENQFYPLVIERLSQQLQREGYHVLMFIADMDEAADGVLAEILEYQVDGIIMASTMLSSTLANSCAEVGVPVVQFNRTSSLEGLPRHTVSAVTSDNYRGGELAAALLLERGCRRIAFLAGLEASSTSIAREHGFVEALASNGVTLAARETGHYDYGHAQAATRRLFAKPNPPDALFAANDHMAIAALDVIRDELQLCVPGDVAVIGFDDVPQAAWGAYSLTSVRQNLEAMVRATVSLMCEQMQGTFAPRNIVIPCELIERSTVRPSS
jgi:DNA-binding LacI/PurR family transcriptional regulator